MTAPEKTAGDEAVNDRVVVTVGTDHHPFDRLIEWVNAWLRQHPERVGAFFMQSGAASVAPLCGSRQFLEVGELDGLLGDAGAVICHGGPGSIADAWKCGHVPIVVPRLRRFGEVVDDHQVDFCAKLGQLGRVRLAQTQAELSGFLDQVPSGFERSASGSAAAEIEATVGRFGALVEELIIQPRRRGLLGQVKRAGRQPAGMTRTQVIPERRRS
jgi:UDP-N-acetylglucosamine transferase subunit ALG13